MYSKKKWPIWDDSEPMSGGRLAAMRQWEGKVRDPDCEKVRDAGGWSVQDWVAVAGCDQQQQDQRSGSTCFPFLLDTVLQMTDRTHKLLQVPHHMFALGAAPCCQLQSAHVERLSLHLRRHMTQLITPIPLSDGTVCSLAPCGDKASQINNATLQGLSESFRVKRHTGNMLHPYRHKRSKVKKNPQWALTVPMFYDPAASWKAQSTENNLVRDLTHRQQKTTMIGEAVSHGVKRVKCFC